MDNLPVSKDRKNNWTVSILELILFIFYEKKDYPEEASLDRFQLVCQTRG